MTKAGYVFIVAGVFVYFLASQTQIGWVYLIDAFIWSLLAFSAVAMRSSLKSLNVERQILLPKSTHSQLSGPLEDEVVEVKVTVANRGRFATHFVTVLDHCPYAPPEKRVRNFLIPALDPRADATFYYETACYQRGHYPSAAVILQASDPLGLMARKRSFELPLGLTVYPAYHPLQGQPSADAVWTEWGQAVMSSAAEELYGSREYRYGDPLKHIHWRNTARLGQFMLKEFEQHRQGATTVVLDTRHAFGSNRETTLEYGIRIAASLARLSSDLGQTINIIAGQEDLYHAGWQAAMDYLARLQLAPDAFEQAPATEPGQVIVAIASAREINLVPALSQMAATGREVLVLLEGFAADERPEEFSSGLAGKNIEIVSCTPGGLEAAISKLATSRFLRARSAPVL